MPRYLIERYLAEGVDEFLDRHPLSAIGDANRDCAVTWLHSFVDADANRIVCLYEAAGPEAIRRAARRSGLPVDVIHRVTVLDPHAIRLDPPVPGECSSPGTDTAETKEL